MSTNWQNFILALILGVAVTALACPVLAQERIDESADLKSDGTVIVSNISGSIKVTGWDREKVEIKGTLGEGTEELVVEGNKNRLEVRVEIPKHARHVEDTHLDVRVPKKCRLDVSAVSADIEVSKCEGKLDVQSVSGDVDVGGKMERVSAESVSGDVVLEIDCGEVLAESVSGDVEIAGAYGDLRMETVSGDCEVSGGNFTSIRATSVSGELAFLGEFVGDGDFAFEAHSGDIVIELTRKPDAEFEVTTFSGDIDNAFGSNGERISKYAPGTELSFTLGSGDARVEVNSFSGDVILRKK